MACFPAQPWPSRGPALLIPKANLSLAPFPAPIPFKHRASSAAAPPPACIFFPVGAPAGLAPPARARPARVWACSLIVNYFQAAEYFMTEPQVPHKGEIRKGGAGGENGDGACWCASARCARLYRGHKYRTHSPSRPRGWAWKSARLNVAPHRAAWARMRSRAVAPRRRIRYSRVALSGVNTSDGLGQPGAAWRPWWRCAQLQTAIGA